MSAESLEIADAKARASYYVLLMLLQRLNPQQPDLVSGMLQGLRADLAAIESNGNSSPSLRAVFKEAEQLLEQASQFQAPVPAAGGV
jgi:hypothetical protein